MVKRILKVEGMTCNSCTRFIESKLEVVTSHVSANYSKDEVEVKFDPEKISLEEIEGIIEEEGYLVVKNRNKKSGFGEKAGLYFMIASLLFLAYYIYKWVIELGLSIPGIGEQLSLVLLFLVGLLTGFHCVSMCGGFMVAYMTKNSKHGNVGFGQHLVYGGAKTFSYIVIGGLFGFIGGIVSFSVGLRGGVAIFAGLFMIAYGLSMMGFKFFRKFQVNPKFLSRWTAKASSNAKGTYKAPLITGLLGGLFIACGPLQAMYLYAAGTGNFLSGALALAAFGLGTLPVLLGFGGIASSVSYKTMRKFMKVSAVVVLILGLIMLNRGLVVIGSPYSFEAIMGSVGGGVAAGSAGYVMSGEFQVIDMTVDRSGWSPDTFTLKKGVPVRWNINVKELTGCNSEILVNEYGLDVKLEKGINVVEFTPNEAKVVRWSCWMGMIPGTFIVTDDGVASEVELEAVAPFALAGGSCDGSCGGGCGG